MQIFKNNHWLTALTLLLLTANIITLVFLWRTKGSDKAGPNQPPPQGQVFEFLNKELKFDAGQQEAFKKLREEHRSASKQILDSIKNAKDALFALLQQPGVSDSLIDRYSSKAARAEQQLDELTFRHFQNLRGLCTTEQQQKFDSIIKEVLQRMGPPKRQGPPKGPPMGEGEFDGPPPPKDQ